MTRKLSILFVVSALGACSPGAVPVPGGAPPCVPLGASESSQSDACGWFYGGEEPPWTLCRGEDPEWVLTNESDGYFCELRLGGFATPQSVRLDSLSCTDLASPSTGHVVCEDGGDAYCWFPIRPSVSECRDLRASCLTGSCSFPVRGFR